MPHRKAFRHGKDESRGLNFNCISSICQDVLKSDNLLHKWGFVDSQSVTTVVVVLKKFGLLIFSSLISGVEKSSTRVGAVLTTSTSSLN